MQTWSELGETQPLAAQILTNSIEKNRVSHAYILHGSRGTGKKSLAELFTKTLFCESPNGQEPCQQCDKCERIASGNHPDVHWVEPEGNSIKNDQIKELRKEFSFTGFESAKKVYVIVAADTLTVNAANRILKFLEEPDTKTTALLLTENAQGLLPTIQSRCQIIDLQPLDRAAFQNRLIQEKAVSITENNAQFLSALTNNIEEAIQLHEDGYVYERKNIVKDLVYTLVTNYDERYLFIHQKWFATMKEKEEQEQGIELLLFALRDIMDYQVERLDGLVIFSADDGLLKRAANHWSDKKVLAMMKVVLQARQKLKQHIHPTLLMEQMVLQL